MCGIIGCTLRRGDAVRLLIEGLRRLEYRGYDSAGVALLEDRRLRVVKRRGPVDAVAAVVSPLRGRTGIGHTRWATHGEPSERNAHPHTDCHGTVAIVHNGVIENCTELREELRGRGHVFLSDTDSEVIAHLIEEGLESGLDLLEAVARAVSRLRGSYAIAVLSPLEPGTIVCARNESPLIVGVAPEAAFCASDLLAIRPYTDDLAALDDGQVALLRPGEVRVFRVDGDRLVPSDPLPVPRDALMGQADKGAYEHFTLKEIHEQPRALANSLRVPGDLLRSAAEDLVGAERVFVVACGTSYNASVAGAYYMTRLSGVAPVPMLASEFPEWAPDLGPDDLVILVSQSGETADTLTAARHAQGAGARTMAIVNVVGSSLDRMSRTRIYIYAGPEVGVAATKTYTNQLSVMLQLAAKAGELGGRLDPDEVGHLFESLRSLPGALEETLRAVEDRARALAGYLASRPSMYYLGRGLHLATAMEGALKMKELSYVHAEAYPAGEMKHGPLALVSRGFPVVFPGVRAGREVTVSMSEVRSRGGYVIAVSDEDRPPEADFVLRVPRVHPLLEPIVHIVPLQLLAYYTAVARGHNPDRPRNLAKSVTVR